MKRIFIVCACGWICLGIVLWFVADCGPERDDSEAYKFK